MGIPLGVTLTKNGDMVVVGNKRIRILGALAPHNLDLAPQTPRTKNLSKPQNAVIRLKLLY